MFCWFLGLIIGAITGGDLTIIVLGDRALRTRLLGGLGKVLRFLIIF
jgi:hypothetical protein